MRRMPTMMITSSFPFVFSRYFQDQTSENEYPTAFLLVSMLEIIVYILIDRTKRFCQQIPRGLVRSCHERFAVGCSVLLFLVQRRTVVFVRV